MHTINSARMLDDLNNLARIGATPEGGVHRPALSPAHLDARQWLRTQIEMAELEFIQDGAGNHFGRLACGPLGAPSLLVGSHLDTVPNGGRYDGALGVIAGLEVLRRVKELDLRLPCHLELVDFTDEEGTLLSLLGSHAFAGLLDPDSLLRPRSGIDALQQGMQRAGLSTHGILAARRDPASLAGYLELHIEQGKRLERSQTQIGVVTGITGICSFWLHFIGQADHAGTCEMQDRLDASLGASAFTLAARRVVLERYPGCTTNIGQAAYSPGAFNIVPQRASLAFECRSADAEQFRRLEAELLAEARQLAQQHSLKLEVELVSRHLPVMMEERMRALIAEAAQALGLSHREMPSYAGHDAQSVAALCPAGMIFVPSAGGASHSPREFTHPQDCTNGAKVLLNAVLAAAQQLTGKSQAGPI